MVCVICNATTCTKCINSVIHLIIVLCFALLAATFGHHCVLAVLAATFGHLLPAL
jgi:hypothetical protein